MDVMVLPVVAVPDVVTTVVVLLPSACRTVVLTLFASNVPLPSTSSVRVIVSLSALVVMTAFDRSAPVELVR
ncbi:hypothetical protein, partial [Clostridium perfringens]